MLEEVVELEVEDVVDELDVVQEVVDELDVVVEDDVDVE